MNTETLNALRLISQGKSAVIAEITADSTPDAEKGILGNILSNLQDQENTLINTTLQDMVNKLNSSNIALQSLNQQLTKTSENIAALSNKIKNISNILSTLAEITSKALSAGLLG